MRKVYKILSTIFCFENGWLNGSNKKNVNLDIWETIMLPRLIAAQWIGFHDEDEFRSKSGISQSGEQSAISDSRTRFMGNVAFQMPNSKRTLSWKSDHFEICRNFQFQLIFQAFSRITFRLPDSQTSVWIEMSYGRKTQTVNKARSTTSTRLELLILFSFRRRRGHLSRINIFALQPFA